MDFSLINILEKDQKMKFIYFLKSKTKVKEAKGVTLLKAIDLGTHRLIEKNLEPMLTEV